MNNTETILTSSFSINEIFYSIQGEGTRAGMPCVFIRLRGCNLQCKWCDTPYARDTNGGKKISGEKIIEKIKSYDCSFVEFTGGEPLLQKDVLPLMSYLCSGGYEVAIETNGSQGIQAIDYRIIKILDIKCPSSEMTEHNLYTNLNFLNSRDEVKFVIANREDYNWAKEILQKYSLNEKVNAVLFSPVSNMLESPKLAQWILKDNLPVRLQLQIHKYIWKNGREGLQKF